MGADRWDEQVGSVADEATLLLESLRRSAQEAAAAEGSDGAASGRGVPSPGGAASGDGGPPHDDGRTASLPPSSWPTEDGPAAHDPLCTWCPLCRSAAVLRSLSPETLVRLADLASVAASVLADLASARARSAGDDPVSDEAATSRRPAAGPPTPRARPIPILDANDPQEAPRG